MGLHFSTANRWFDRLNLACLCLLTLGIPLFFSATTRSVFEVNKLLLLRVVLLFLSFLWLLKSCLLKDSKRQAPAQVSYRLAGFHWKKIGLEIPVLLWICTHLLSIIFSENIFIALIGAYDRWEGLMTVLNYIALFYITAKHVKTLKYRLIMFYFCLFATGLSAIYGIIQSLGYDFMNWSTSPTSRVFACINNPVHFCAYVAMMVPVGLSLSFYTLSTHYSQLKVAFQCPKIGYGLVAMGCVVLSYMTVFKDTSWAFLQFLILFASIAVPCYRFKGIIPQKNVWLPLAGSGVVLLTLVLTNSFLLDRFQSTALYFSAATVFIGSALGNRHLLLFRFSTVFTLLLYYAILLSFSRATVIGFSIAMAFFYQLFLQKNIHTLSLTKLAILFITTAWLQILLIFKLHLMGTIGIGVQSIALLLGFYGLLWVTCSKSQRTIKQGTYCALLFILSILPFADFSFQSTLSFPLFLILFLAYRTLSRRVPTLFITTLLPLCLLLNLTFYMATLTEISGFFVFLYLNYRYLLRPHFNQDSQIYIVSLFITKVLLLLIPLMPILTQSFFAAPSDSLEVASNIKGRMKNLSNNKARLFMWKSVPPWILDRPLLGTGPDTVRFLYPMYRHPQYAKHEGGHNFTPDRLHNEYLNTLVTHGLLGFMIKYIAVYGGWYLLMLRLFKRATHAPTQLILIGIIVAPSIYLIQVLFNFGVVATLFLFYFLLGIGLSFVHDTPIKTPDETT